MVLVIVVGDDWVTGGGLLPTTSHSIFFIVGMAR